MFKKFLLSIISTILISIHGYTQSHHGPNIGCKDATLAVQAQELKQSFIAQGFELINDATLSMESHDVFPIILKLDAGKFYQLIFIGNMRARKMDLELFGEQKEFVLAKSCQPYQRSINTISISFTPAKTGAYTILLSQKLKQELFKKQSNQTVCGSISVLKLKQ